MKSAVVLLVGILMSGVCSAQSDDVSWDVWVDTYTAPLTSVSERVLLHQVPATRQPFVQEKLWKLWGKESGMGDDFVTHYRNLFSLVVGKVNASHQEKIVVLMRTALLFGVPERVYVINRRPIRYEHLMYIGTCEDVPALEVWTWGRDGPVLLFKDDVQILWRGTLADLVSPLYSINHVGGQNPLSCFTANPLSDVLHIDTSVFSDVLQAPYRSELYHQRFVRIVSRVRVLTSFQVRDVVSLYRVGNRVRVALSLLLSRDEYDWKVERIGESEMVAIDIRGTLVAKDGTTLKRGYRFMCPYDTTAFFFEFSDDELLLEEATYDATFTVSHYDAIVGKAMTSFTVSPPVPGVTSVVTKPIPTPAPTLSTASQFPFNMNVHVPDIRYVVGTTKVETVSPRMDEIERVCFFKDQNSRPVYCKRQLPFEGYVEMGSIPHATTISATAYGKDDRVLATSSVAVNTFRSSTALRLKPFEADDLRGNKVKLEGYVTHAPSKTCRGLQVFQNNVLRHTYPCEAVGNSVFSFELPLDGMDAFPAHVIRVCVTFEDDSFVEDVTVVSSRFSSHHEISVVELPVFVTRHGKPVSGLVQQDFSLREDGVAQQVSHVFQDEAPVRAGIVLDVSASVGSTLIPFKQAAFSFAQRLLGRTSDNKVMVARFASQTKVVTDVVGADNIDQVTNVLSSMFMTSGRTALYDAISAMVAELSETNGKRAIVIFTDGKENASGDADVFARTAGIPDTPSALLRAQQAQHRASDDAFEKLSMWLAHSNVVLYLIQYSPDPISEDMKDRLTALCDPTGGRAFFLKDVSELEGVYEEVVQGLKTGYLLVYTPSHPCQRACGHRIQVEVDSSLQVRAPLSRYEGIFD
jgi:VWFA-related protein